MLNTISFKGAWSSLFVGIIREQISVIMQNTLLLRVDLSSIFLRSQSSKVHDQFQLFLMHQQTMAVQQNLPLLDGWSCCVFSTLCECAVCIKQAYSVSSFRLTHFLLMCLSIKSAIQSFKI